MIGTHLLLLLLLLMTNLLLTILLPLRRRPICRWAEPDLLMLLLTVLLPASVLRPAPLDVRLNCGTQCPCGVAVLRHTTLPLLRCQTLLPPCCCRQLGYRRRHHALLLLQLKG